ncbi:MULTISPECIES: SDR family oxidoreductase [unclassified Chelatococcus]|uniref:SDR family oxidoreductase n=1 Tax=unclassified Chelatococcus TaxID=2638111 RepID=UPI001BCEE278|nr:MULTISPECIES: SDR family oxidoreductase [unclassified Chelatococcus]MBS7701554.1 SDR family oxidoreductase [Chelatococcus sp. YT9]MBX3557389.1 SDR family oxidoreductase [Chelatococcus sp.]
MQKIAVVTGAGSGIGRAVALKLAQGDYLVALVGRRVAELEETASLAAGETLVVPADVSQEAAVAGLFETIERKFGRVDLLFNNAGRGAPAVPIDELAVETWRAVVDVNLTGSFLCARAAFGLMRRQKPGGGRIINNGSISAHAPRPFATAYVSTKHAITGLTKQLALDGRNFDIVCGQIDIGNAESPLANRMRDGVLQADLSRKPEPLIDPMHIADAVRYMADLPLEANVLFMTVMASKMPFVGRG